MPRFLKAFAFVVLLVLKKPQPVSTFSPIVASTWRGHRKSVTLSNNSKLFGPEEEEGKDDGAALAKQFYDQLKQRDEAAVRTPSQASSKDNNRPSASSSSSSSMADAAGSLPPRPKKFTGKPDEITFGRNNGNSNSFLNNNANNGDDQQRQKSPREQMRERENQLVERAEKGLAYQAVLAVAVAILYLYVGLTGGIQSGSDYDLGNDENIAEEILIPEPRDATASYWL
jgi:hypothetical protein